MEEIVSKLIEGYGLVGIFFAYLVYSDYTGRVSNKKYISELIEICNRLDKLIAVQDSRIKNLEKEVFKNKK